jgi:WD40 repeat protein
MEAVPPGCIGGGEVVKFQVRGSLGIGVALAEPEVLDSDNTPAQGVAALRRRRHARFPGDRAATFIDFAAALAHPEVVEDVRITAGGTRGFVRGRVRQSHSPGCSTVWAWSPGEVKGSMILSGHVSGMDVSQDGRTLALWSREKGTFNVLEPTTMRSSTIGWRTPHVGRWGVRFDPRDAVLSPDGDAVALVGERGQLAVYRPVDALGPSIMMSEGVRGVAWSPDGERLAIVDGTGLGVFEVATSERVWRVPRAHSHERACHIAWDPTGRLLLIADAELEVIDGPLHDGRNVFVERETPRGSPELRHAQDGAIASVLPYEAHPTQIAWSDDGSRCLLVARPGGLIVWDAERHEPVVHDPNVATAAFGPRGAWVALAEEGAREVVVRWLP